MSIIYRVRIWWSGEIMETSNFKTAYLIARREAKDLIRGESNYVKAEVDVEKCIYDCSPECDDFWSYPLISKKIVCSFTCTRYLSVVIRNDNKAAII